MPFSGYAASSPKGPLEPFQYEPEPLGSEEVEIAITHCGICHSDVHLVDGDWGDVFPVLPGHEIIGTVVEGRGFEPGQRVGVGWQRSSCGSCEHCRDGDETLCADNQATCMGHHGGFADRIRVNGRFALSIPDGLPSETAAPLLCGGITLYAPLARFAREGMSVGVIGIGGLGHLGLQFARAMGCEVTAISHSASKEGEARGFGAHHFLAGAPAPGTLDLLLNTAPFAPDMAPYLASLRPKGVFCQLGAAAEPLTVPSMPLIMGRRTITGSAVGAPGVIREMLAFAAEHEIVAKTELMPMSKANEALDRTRTGKARYRMVLVA